MSKFEINDELLNQRIELYLEKHQDEIVADIDTRIDRMIKKVIRELFKTPYYGDKMSTAEKLLTEKIDGIASKVIKELEIDKEEITGILHRQITRRVKNIDIDIKL